MRRRVTGERKLFKGSVFVEFHTLEDAVAFLARADVKFGGAQLLTESKYAHCLIALFQSLIPSENFHCCVWRH